ncbi:type IV toxin-antitoxin system AbiEi family antitoxin domain-containing protein [Sinomonas gamaensis]|uniref:type IV toxin-antitoxin system AbiEi family antitoxin domain-containing protein n=1 Tax=Sinomonas gamaensis TaxID=2565624 RepID=UPI001108B4F4|nr:type IV toxin-antitoxin system AbiEi family antitoxin domain-containing protein [Sinomonas gamaensis]
MTKVLKVLARWGGVARRADLFHDGVSRGDLEEGLKSGLIVRTRRGIYALPDADPVLVRCASTDSLLTCVSAARAHGLWVVREPQEIHILRSDGRFSSDRAVVHRQSWVEPPARSHIASQADVLLHSLRCLPELEALVIVESAIQQGFSRDFLLELLPGRRNAPARHVIDSVGTGADSLIEILAREHLRRAGFRVRPQVEVEGVGWMDLLIEDFLDVETDGQLHNEPVQRAKDYRRDRSLQLRGYEVLRYTYSDVVDHPEAMVAEVERVVARRRSLRLPPPPR